MRDTRPLLEKVSFPAIRRGKLDTLQVNVGYRCNQSCFHCHVNAGPNRTEEISAEVAEVATSMPCYLQDNVERQSGKGAFDGSIRGLRKLNAFGFGRDPALTLNLVYNPQGPSPLPPQGSLEANYKRVLSKSYGIIFNKLFVFANMPIQCFGTMLINRGEFDGYLQLLQDVHLDVNFDDMMCRHLISVDWRGYVYDCDFNQMLDLPLTTARHARAHLSDPIDADIAGDSVRVTGHCYGCTAGQGSSCGGVLKEAAE